MAALLAFVVIEHIGVDDFAHGGACGATGRTAEQGAHERAGHTWAMTARIEPGIVAVIVESNDARNIGAMVNIEEAYYGSLPEGEERRTGWWIVLPRVPLVSDATEDERNAIDAPGAGVGGRYLAHNDSLLPLLAGSKPGTVLRWDGR